MKIEEEISVALQNLITALTQSNVKEQMKWHKVLYKIGKPALPKLCSTVQAFNASKIKSWLKLKYITGLMYLIHDIDETEGKQLTHQPIQNGCDTLITRQLKSISAFSLDNYTQYEIKGIKIFEEKGLVTGYKICPLLQKWLKNIPDEDLKEIERLYVVSYAKQDHSGKYTPHFLQY